MDSEKKKRLEAKGWKFGDYADFLGMTPAEKTVVELRLAAKRELEKLRAESSVTQKELAKRMGMKQPNVSRLLRDLGSASLETLLRALAALGSDTPRKVAAAMM